MRIPRLWALVVGLLTLWPIVYMFIFKGSIFFVLAEATGRSSPGGIPDPFRYLFVAHLGTMLVMLGLLVFYIVHVFKNVAFRDDRRVLWALVLFMGGPISMPVYWWLHVWHRPASGTGDPKGSTGAV